MRWWCHCHDRTRQPPAHYRLLVLLCEKYVMPSCGRRSSLAQVAAKARTNRPSVPAASNAHSDSCMHAMRDLSGGRPQYVHPVPTNHKSDIVWRQRDTERHKKGRCSVTTETSPCMSNKEPPLFSQTPVADRAAIDRHIYEMRYDTSTTHVLKPCPGWKNG